MQLRCRIATAAGLAAIAASLLVFTAPGQAQSARHRAGLVIQYADGEIDARCVEFEEPEITGYELLRRSGLPLVIAPGSFGAAVCKIGAQGCDYPAQSCFCQCENMNAGCVYWISFLHVNGAWKYATLGASNTKVKEGDLQAWVWGSSRGDSSEGTSAPLPPAMTFDQICPATQASAQASAQSEATTPTASLSPTTAPAATPQADADTNSSGLIVFGAIVVALSAILLVTAGARRRETDRSRTN